MSRNTLNISGLPLSTELLLPLRSLIAVRIGFGPSAALGAD